MIIRLHPDVVVAWRGPRTLQIGVDARHGLVLHGISTGQEQVVDALVHGDHSRRGLFRFARRIGVPGQEVDDLLRELTERGLLIGPQQRLPGRLPMATSAASARAIALRYPGSGGWPVLRERGGRTVLLMGAGLLAARVASSLGRAGVGGVLVQDEARVRRGDVEAGGPFTIEDVGRRRQHVLAGRVDGVGVAEPSAVVDLAVLLVDGALAPSSTDQLLRDDITHLPVVLRERDAMIGPLVRPGLTCCLRCVDLYRVDRDREWPTVASQAATHAFAPRDPLLLDLVSVTTVVQVLDALDARGRPLTDGVSMEVSVDDPVPVLRSWPAHPRCGCTWPPPAASRSRLAALG